MAKLATDAGLAGVEAGIPGKLAAAGLGAFRGDGSGSTGPGASFGRSETEPRSELVEDLFRFRSVLKPTSLK